MGEFVIKTKDGEEFTITADDEAKATEIFGHYQNNNYSGPTDKNGVPEGMVFDPATNRMVDARALAQHQTPEGSLAGTWAKGVPFVGEYADELAGWLGSSDDAKNHPNETQVVQTEVARQSQKLADEKHPIASTTGKVIAGLSALPAAVEFAPALIPSSWRLGAQALTGAAVGGATGALEGAVSGYGEGTDGNRTKTAVDRAVNSGEIGVALGGLAPYASKIVGNATKWAKDKLTTNKALDKIGVSRPAADVLSSKLLADDTLGPEGAKRLAKAGEDAMLADAGPTAAGLLDTTIQRSGQAGRIANAAVEKRAGEAANKLNGTMDLILGQPPGINAAAKKIYADSAAARQAAYNTAYSKPIDYSSSAGRDVEDVFMRTPDSILGPAIKRANDTMKINRMQNYQIMASIGDDGSVLFREMPNVVQADYLKRALNDIAEESKKEGVMSPAGQDAAKLARQLRTALADAVPEYATASKLGGDVIEEKRALLLGRDLLNPSVTREDVREGLDGIGDAERKQLMLGLRQNIDD